MSFVDLSRGTLEIGGVELPLAPVEYQLHEAAREGHSLDELRRTPAQQELAERQEVLRRGRLALLGCDAKKSSPTQRTGVSGISFDSTF